MSKISGIDAVHVRGFRVVLGPDSNVLVEMVRSEDRRIASQVVEVVHDDGDEQIQHLRITIGDD